MLSVAFVFGTVPFIDVQAGVVHKAHNTMHYSSQCNASVYTDSNMSTVKVKWKIEGCPLQYGNRIRICLGTEKDNTLSRPCSGTVKKIYNLKGEYELDLDMEPGAKHAIYLTYKRKGDCSKMQAVERTLMQKFDFTRTLPNNSSNENDSTQAGGLSGR